MKIDYKLNENDFLIHLMYQIDYHKDYKKAKMEFYFSVPLIMILVGAILDYISDEFFFVILSLVLVIFWLPYAPKRYKNEKLKEMKVIAKDHVRKRDSENAILIINQDYIISKEDFYESKHYKTEIADLTEIKNYYIINLKDKINKLLIPIKYIKNPEEFVNKFINMNIPYIDHSSWEFKNQA